MTLLETAVFWSEVGLITGLIISLIDMAIEHRRLRKTRGGGIKPSATPPPLRDESKEKTP